MKFLFLLLTLSFFTHVQSQDKRSIPVVRIDTSTSKPARIVLRCGLSQQHNEPLIIVDGEVLAPGTLKDINPNDIESIMVLKNSEATAIYGCRAMNGVIVITTRLATAPVFVIRDSEDGEVLPDARVDIYLANDSTRHFAYVSNIDGKVIAKDLKKGNAYRIVVTAMGHDELTRVYTAGAPGIVTDLHLSRHFRVCHPVTVVGYPVIRCRRIQESTEATCSRKWMLSEGKSPAMKVEGNGQSIARMFPNPVARGQQVTIEHQFGEHETLQVQLLDVSGRIIYREVIAREKSRQTLHFNAPAGCTPGMYVVQLVHASKPIQQFKMMIQ